MDREMEMLINRNNVNVVINRTSPTTIIGKRINPAGKAWLKEALRNGDMDRVAQLAKEQVEAGADILDINVTIPGADEVDLLPQVVEVVQAAVEVPLAIDSSKPDAIRAALPLCDGKVIVNSVNGDPEVLEALLPEVKRYDAAVIGILMSKEKGIPKDAGSKLEVAQTILEMVETAGIPKSDLFIDCLTLAVGAEPDMGLIALETIRGMADKLDLNMTMGISNVSFGLLNRACINAAFIAMTAAARLTCAIVNPHSRAVREAILAADVLLKRDKRAMRFLKYYRQQKAREM
jgi:5-methyltetrahydrofolate--homocysteine methyltransferase